MEPAHPPPHPPAIGEPPPERTQHAPVRPGVGVRAAAGAAAALGILGDTYHLVWAFLLDADRADLLTSPFYRAHGVAIAVAYALATYALLVLIGRRRDTLGAFGTAGALVATVGMTLVAGDYWAESAVVPGLVATSPGLADTDATGLHLALVIAAFGLLAIGWVLVAIALAMARVIGWPLAAFISVAALLAFTPLPGSNVLLFLGIGLLGSTRPPPADAMHAHAALGPPAQA